MEQANATLKSLEALLEQPLSDWKEHTVPSKIWPKENSSFVHADPRTKRLYVHEGYAGQGNRDMLLAQQAARVALHNLESKYGPSGSSEQTMPYHGNSSATMSVTGLSRQPDQAEQPSGQSQSPREDTGNISRTRGFAKV